MKPSPADIERARQILKKNGLRDRNTGWLVKALADQREEARIGWVSHAVMVSQINASVEECAKIAKEWHDRSNCNKDEKCYGCQIEAAIRSGNVR